MNSSIRAKARTWRGIIKQARERWQEVDGDPCTAAFGFYLLLSLFPLIIIMLVAVGSMIVERKVATREVVQLINRYTPLTAEQEAEGRDEGKVSPRLVDADGLGSTTTNSASFQPK